MHLRNHLKYKSYEFMIMLTMSFVIISVKEQVSIER